VVKAVAALAVVALIAAPIIYAVHSGDTLNISLHITGIDGGVLLDIEAVYRSSMPTPAYGYISVDAATTYDGSRYSGNIVLSGEIYQNTAGVSCGEISFSYRLQTYGRGLNSTATAAYLYSFHGTAFSLQLEAESIEVGRGVARLNVSALLQSGRPLRELLPLDALNVLTTLSPQTVNAMLLSGGVNWLFIDELRVELVNDSALKGYASLLIDYVQLLRSANLSDQLINGILNAATASYSYTYEFSQTSYTNCTMIMAGRGYFTYDNLTEESVKAQQTLMTDVQLSALLSNEGREALGFLRELVLMPSNSTITFRFDVGGGLVGVSFSAKGVRLIHRDLGGVEGSKRVAQIVVSLVESLRTYIPVPANISVTSDVPATADPAVASGISRAAGLAVSGRLFSQTFSAIIGTIALPVMYISTVTTVATTVTAPQIPVIPTPQTLTVTATQTTTQFVTTTYTQTVPTTVTATATQTLTQTLTQVLTQTATTTLTTTVTRTSVESITAGAVIAIIGIAVGLLLRRK